MPSIFCLIPIANLCTLLSDVLSRPAPSFRLRQLPEQWVVFHLQPLESQILTTARLARLAGPLGQMRQMPADAGREEAASLSTS